MRLSLAKQQKIRDSNPVFDNCKFILFYPPQVSVIRQWSGEGEIIHEISSMVKLKTLFLSCNLIWWPRTATPHGSDKKGCDYDMFIICAILVSASCFSNYTPSCQHSHVIMRQQKKRKKNTVCLSQCCTSAIPCRSPFPCCATCVPWGILFRLFDLCCSHGCT